MQENFPKWRDELFTAVIEKFEETGSPGVDLSALVTELGWKYPKGWVTYAAHSFATAGWAEVNFGHVGLDTGITLALTVGCMRAWEDYLRDLKDHPPSPAVVAPAERLKTALDELEDAMSSAKSRTGNIGHNNPPEAIGVPPYGDEEYQAIQDNIEILRKQISADTLDARATEAAGKDLSNIGGKIRSYCAEQGDNFVTSVVKSSGTTVGENLGTAILVVLVFLGDKLIQVALAAWEYLASLSLLP